MGKNIRITALILAVTLLLNMVVLPVRAEGEAAPQTLTGSDNTTQDTDQPSDSAEPLAEGGGDKQPDTDAGSGGQDDSGTNDEQDDSGNTDGQDTPENTGGQDTPENIGGQDTPENTGGQDDSGNTDEQESSSDDKEEDSLLEEELLTEEILVNEQGLLTAMLLDDDVSALAEREYRSVAEVFAGKTGLTLDDSGINITSIDINSGDDLIRLSNVDPALYQSCTINIVSNTGGYNTTGKVTSGTSEITFEGLGKAGIPFKGKVSVQDGSEEYPIVLARPLFNALYDCAQIYSAKGVKEPGLLLQSTNTDAQLAMTVTHDDAVEVANQWQVKMSAPSASSSSVTPPLIKTIGTNAKVSLRLINETFSETSESGREVSSIQGSQHAGILCASMGEGSSLTLAGWTGTMPAVTAKDGDAGLLVGTMASGAALSLGKDVSLTIPNVTASGSAGGIVGSATDAIIPTISLENASATISGTHAGGLIGSYTYSGADDALSAVSQNISGITVNGSSNAGGVFGVFNNTSNSATFTISSSVSTTALSGNNVGGLIGQYSARNLEAALKLTSPSVSSTLSGNANAYGGLIGWVSGGENSRPAYVEVRENNTETITVTNNGTANFYGGLVGSLSNNGHMLKTGAVTVNNGSNIIQGNTAAGGLVGKFESGVLCLDGTVHAALPQGNNEKRGSILGERGNTLVYATTNGETGWPYYGDGKWNAIGNWGQVLRDDELTVGTNKLLTEATTNHTVSICAASDSISDVVDFGAAALRFQLDPVGALEIPDDYTLGDNFSITLSLSGTIDLGGTGLTGFQRDYSSATVAKNVTLNGSNHAITFPDITVYCGGSHNRQGLFAKTNGLTVEGVTLKDGRSDTKKDACGIRLVAYGNATCAGALVAESSGAATLTNVKSYVNIEVTNNGNGEEKVSGLIAYQTGGSAAFVNCEWDSDLTYSTTNGDNYQFAGGFLARAESKLDISVRGCSILGRILKSKGKLYGGGLIGSLYENNNANVLYRLGISGLTVDGVEITASGCTYTGGLLGFEWMNTTADISGVTVKNSVFTGGSTSFGGLVYKGSGYWKVSKKTTEGAGNGVGIQFAAGTSANSFTGITTAGETSGLFVCHGDKLNGHSNALYLEILDGAYTIGENSVELPESFAFFDEIIGQTKSKDGNGIVSIGTSNGLIYAEEGEGDNKTRVCNTYKQQLSTNYQNKNTRYYYNLDIFGAAGNIVEGRVLPDGPIDSEGDMVLFSAYTHCYSGLQKYFYTNPGNITNPTEGTIDLTGYSYYPAEKGIYANIENADITFAYEEIEGRENAVDNKLLSNSNSQHYGMHTGIFTEVVNGSTTKNAELTVTNLTLSGTVGGLDGNYGALIRDNTQGSGTSAKMILNINGVKLDGIRVYPAPGGEDIKPLLIHSIGSFSTLDMKGVETLSNTAYTGLADGVYAASSLIGPVGGSTGQHIQLTFSGMVLDGRTVKDTSNAVYGTYRTIFSRALFLEEFCYTGDSGGTYNFTSDVKYTLGQELSNTEGNTESNPSGRNNNEQYCFFDSETKVCTVLGADTVPATCFSSYRRYVHEVEGTKLTGPERTNHELDINLSSAGLTEGCGTYSHPYIIDSSKQLQALSEVFQTGTFKDGWEINLDVTVLDGTFANQDGHIESDASHRCEPYTYSSGNWTNQVDPTTTLKDAQKGKVLNYLRNAYYQIKNNDITLSGTWTGLGSSADYAFCGVIDGNGKTITINRTGSANQFGGLIKFSLGSVVKNLTIKYTAAPTVTLSGGNTQNTTTSDASFFGGVVGWCLGGDTIIDNVTVTYTAQPSADSHLAAVGGYVGMVGGAIMSTTNSREKYGGGVVFRNMTTDTIGLPEGRATGKEKYFYYNPYVGRVLDGYAISEDKNLDNTDKNYLIPYIAPCEKGEDGNLIEPYLNYSNGTITVKDAKGLWLLSAIANSGSASVKNSENWAYYKGKTRTAGYHDVGNTNTPDLADEAYMGGETRADDASAPYLVAKFAPGMQNLTEAVTIVLAQGANFDMTSFGNGFRGIGASYATNANNSSNHRLLQISGLVGNGNTVKLAQERKEYTEEKNNWTSIGSGLFVLLRTSGNFTASNLTFTGKTGIAYYNGTTPITDNTMDSYIDRVYEVGAGALAANLANGSDADITVDSVKLDNLSVNVQKSDNKTIRGSTHAGGLFGSARFANDNPATLKLQDCTYSDLTVIGRDNAGGFLGYVEKANTEILYTKACEPLSNGNISSTLIKNSKQTGVGGLMGYWLGKDGKTYSLKIRGISENQPLAMNGLTVSCGTNDGDNDKVFCGGLAGLWYASDTETVGTSIKNISIQGIISISGGSGDKSTGNTGGLVGAITNNLSEWKTGTSNMSIDVSNIHIADEASSTMTVERSRQIGAVFGVVKVSKTVTIQNLYLGAGKNSVTVANRGKKSDQSAGGVIGIGSYAPTITMENLHLNGVTILGHNNSSISAGMVIGRHHNQNGRATMTMDMKNVELHNCTIVVDSAADNSYAGLLYGQIHQEKQTITGSNILIKDCTVGLSLKVDCTGTQDLTSGEPVKIGLKNASTFASYDTLKDNMSYLSFTVPKNVAILGGKVGGTVNVKLVGISIQQPADRNTLPMKDFGTAPSSGSYVIRSDYTGAANGVASAVTTKPDGTRIPGVGALTGDGAGFITVNNESKSIASQIWTDSKGSENLNLKYYSQIQESLKYLKPLVTGETIQFTDFKTAAESNATNFPVISLQTSSDDEVNNSLFSCISLLSNWEEYSNWSKKTYYKLSLTSYKWTKSGFTASDDPSLRLGNDGKFYLNAGKYDNQKDQFNLIDVAYYDPTVANPTDNDVVYHLYIPVVVKKMFEFKFWAAAKMGTTYIVDDYGTNEHQLTAAAIGTHGEPVTALLNFEYQWTMEEWKTAMESGQNLLWNFNHGISLLGGQLPAGTKLTLVDRNNSDKAFYKILSGPSDYISFSDFTDNAGTSWSGDHKYLCDELKLTAEQSDEGTYCYLAPGENGTGPAEATLRDVNGNYYRPVRDTDVQKDRHDLTIGATTPISEQYYLTIQTPQTNSLVNVTIRCNSRLENPEKGGLPSKRIEVSVNHEYTRYGSENVVILGNFFNQEVTVETEREAELITVEDATIPLTLHTTIQVNDDSKKDYVAYASGQRLYQCFELKLKKYQSSSEPENCNIVSDTELLVQFYRGGTAEENKVGGLYRYIVPSPQATFRLEFPGELKGGNIVPGIPAEALNSSSLDLYAKVQMNYTASAIQDQFPKRENSSDDSTGIAVFASSNLAYTSASLKNTTSRSADIEARYNGTIRHYYREDFAAASLHYYAYEDQDGVPAEGVSELGINGRDGDSFTINSVASYDVSALPNVEKAQTLNCTLTLSQRTGSSYENPLYSDISLVKDYLDQLNVRVRYKQGGKLIETDVKDARDGTVSFELTNFDASVPIQIPVDLTVITGSRFEEKQLTYANCRLRLAVELLDVNGNEISGSDVMDYIIYTNAKIYPYVIK